MPRIYYEHVIVGGLREDYFITHAGEVHLRRLGGNAVYAAVGARVWVEGVGIVSRIGENYPQEWLAEIQKRGVDVSGVKILPGVQETRTFYAYTSPEERVDTDPAFHFRRLGLPVPRELTDYVSSTEGQDSRSKFGMLAVRPGEVDRRSLDARAVHFAPYDFMTHRTVPDAFRSAGVRLITLDPSVRYMQPSYAREVAHVVNGLDVFLPSELEVRSFFREDYRDEWQAAEAFGEMGCKVVVIKLGARGQAVFDADGRKKWHVPAYPATVRDVTGAGDAYCGGFIAGFLKTFDPVEAALHGSVSASLVIEGMGALYALGADPRLAVARLDSLRNYVRMM